MQASTSSAGVLDAALDRLGRIGRFLWSAWIGLAALSLIAALWQLGHEIFGDFVLPAPLPVIAHIQAIVAAPESHPVILATAERALVGLALSLLVGGGLGLVIGYSPAAIRIMRPVVTILIGVPPIAWIVVVMIWFGSTDTTIIATVVAAAAPLLLIGAAEGVITRNRGLDDMARAFGAGPLRRATLGLRQAATTLFPALMMASGTAFKVAVMSELLTNAGGVGGALADARATLDVGEALAWVALAVALLLLVEYGLMHPVRSEFERWRSAAQPWGVKR
ncbi:MAG: ABC transporter permease subunit [Hyphomonadaceae bacterium]|nr:ABC transporter permease subunit [Hyphomonadaceae bacterium]GIK50513.1 MAG: ABC transporter permease [Alphaproteobacteria bacterium]